MIIADTPKKIRLLKYLTWKASLKLEIAGMKKHGQSAYSMVKKHFGFHGNKARVLAQLEQHIKADSLPD